MIFRNADDLIHMPHPAALAVFRILVPAADPAAGIDTCLR